ncbi:hypothetical protein NWT09_08365 [Mycolicibacterium sp. jd]|uniref:hypothetical protein n=1 Tax=unclassified Mycolicibacterium TaxID=2636767 RepID=UPI00351B32A9
MTAVHDPDDEGLVYSPTPLMPEVYLDLDLMLLTAVDARGQWPALVAGTQEVLCRFDHLADERVFCASARSVIADISSVVKRLNDLGCNEVAHWVKSEVVDVLTAHQELHERCIDQLRSAAESQTVTAISDAASSLHTAAQHMSVRRFAPFPDRVVWDFNIKLAVLAAMSAESRRNPLRKQLDGAGGAAGSAEFNPYVAAMFELERVTHQRVYRILYSLAEHAGIDLNGDELFQRPEVVESQPF